MNDHRWFVIRPDGLPACERDTIVARRDRMCHHSVDSSVCAPEPDGRLRVRRPMMPRGLEEWRGFKRQGPLYDAIKELLMRDVMPLYRAAIERSFAGDSNQTELVGIRTSR